MNILMLITDFDFIFMNILNSSDTFKLKVQIIKNLKSSECSGCFKLFNLKT